MCGIAGIIAKNIEKSQDLYRVTYMSNTLAHRGPDGAGEYHNNHLALAMRRLSIIDLNTGWQPLYNEDHSLVLIANGEIYNFVELRSQLQACGHRFQTGSDCETILHLYEEYGVDCVYHLRGMFAFALWDTSRKRVILARDRMGEKPLYLYESDKQFLFASELKALLRSGLVPFELDPVSIDLYFHYQYVPEPRTPLRHVRKLPAGHFLTIDVEPWRVHEHCYWRMEDAPPLEGDPAELIRAELDKVSEIIIRSDVPVGVALSGGLDSSAIAALAARKYPGTIQAFSVGYPGRPASDERNDAKALANYLDMPFYDVELCLDEMVAFFPELNYWRDDPIADISGYGYYAVNRLAREHGVSVLLQGQGGDELFWGYPWVRQAVTQSKQKAQIVAQGWGALPDLLQSQLPSSWRPRTVLRWTKSGFGTLPSWDIFQRYRSSKPDCMVFYDLTPDFCAAQLETPMIYTSNFQSAVNDNNRANTLFTFSQPWPQIDVRMTRLISETYLLENGIAQGDRLSMASSIELRLPLVDHGLVETVIGLRKQQPNDFQLPAKSWFKAALIGILPEWVLNRPKRGFAPPVHDWHRAIFATYGKNLKDGVLVEMDILKPESADELSEGVFPNNAIVPLSFKALVLEIWCRQMSQTL